MNVWLFLHLAGAVLLIGNIITAAFWKIRADLRKNPVVIHHTAKTVMFADLVFTLPGLLLLIISGIVMAVRANLLAHGFNWLTLSLVLFAIAGVVWLAVLIPLQRAMIRHSAACIESGNISKAYVRAARLWDVFGIIATLLPVIIFYLMISKSF